MVPMWTVEDPLPASIWWAMDSAVLIGMAKPWLPCDWPLYWNVVPREAAVSMPSTWPEVFTSAPPESPGWMSAFVSMSPLSCSLVPSPESCAVIDWLSGGHGAPGCAGRAARAAGVADAHDVLVRPRRPTSCRGWPSGAPMRSSVAAPRRRRSGRSPTTLAV